MHTVTRREPFVDEQAAGLLRDFERAVYAAFAS